MNASPITSTAAEPVLNNIPQSRVARILIATDGTETSHAAYAAAELIAASCRVQVHVLSVLELLPVMVPTPGTPIVTTGIDRSREDALRIDIVEQLLKLGRLAKWTTEIRHGDPATVIAEVAKEGDADLIIVGASPHGMVDRLLGEETAAHLARRVNRPLLVAAPSLTRLPRRVIVALDLAAADRTMLAETLEILGSAESVSLLHVTPRAEFLGVDWAEFDGGYHAEVERAFGEASAALETLPRVQPERVVMHGDAAREIARFADSVTAEMIVLGVKPGRSFAVTAGGGIALKVMRASRCSVLLIPAVETQKLLRVST